MTTGEESVRAAFLDQANSCERLGSPFTARMCRLVADRLDGNSSIGRRILGWDGDPSSAADSVPLRLAGTLHALLLSGMAPAFEAVYPPRQVDDDALWAVVSDVLGAHETFVLERLNSAPQTNEVRRSGTLLAGFLTIASLTGLPLALSEVGASAGLNLNFDRYRYRLGETEWGEKSTVVLAPEWTGPPPPQADLRVAARAGCDLNPLDPSSAEDRLRLTSYIWADQADRIERTRNALAVAVETGVRVERADAIAWLKRRLSTPKPGLAHVVYHSVAWQYFPETLKREGEAVIAEAGARATTDAPIARLQMEADASKDGATLSLQLWPSGEIHELGRADFHGRWIKWKGWPVV